MLRVIRWNLDTECRFRYRMEEPDCETQCSTSLYATIHVKKQQAYQGRGATATLLNS